MTAVIQTDKLTKQYGVHRGIVDVNLMVEQGAVFGFLGPNGAGKTTAIRTLGGSSPTRPAADRRSRAPDRPRSLRYPSYRPSVGPCAR
jgi:ABC-type multidrug transport system ATPase subunit